MSLEDPALNPQQSDSHIRRSTSSSHSDRDVFPPRSTSTDGGYNPDEMIEFWIHEYEDVLLEVFGEGEADQVHEMWHGYEAGHSDGVVNGRVAGSVPSAAARDDPAWVRLDEIMRTRNGAEDDAVSDSESVVTVGELGEEATAMGAIELSEVGEFARQQMEEPSSGKNTWEVSYLAVLRLKLTEAAHVTYDPLPTPPVAPRTTSSVLGLPRPLLARRETQIIKLVFAPPTSVPNGPTLFPAF